MTLLLTMVGPPGIVHVSDSNVSYSDGSRAGVRNRKPYKKLFKAKSLRIGVACAGVWDLKSRKKTMDEWLPARIGQYEADGGTTVRGLADYLGRSLECDLEPDEMRTGSWLHVAGYTPDGDRWHPEMYAVGNVKGIGERGNYLLPGQLWFRPLMEEYWTPRNPTPDGQPAESNDPYGLWLNGFPDGRVAWAGLHYWLGNFLEGVWTNDDWKFRRPRTLREYAAYLSLHLSVITHLFQISDYRGEIIGGRTQRLLIRPPRRVMLPPAPATQ